MNDNQCKIAPGKGKHKPFVVEYRTKFVVACATKTAALDCVTAFNMGRQVNAASGTGEHPRLCSHCKTPYPHRRLCTVRGVGLLCPGCYHCWKVNQVPQAKI